jgi:hypothetical protein
VEAFKELCTEVAVKFNNTTCVSEKKWQYQEVSDVSKLHLKLATYNYYYLAE